MTRADHASAFADRAPENERPRLHFKLLEVLGSQPGLQVGSDEARCLLHSFRPWIYDRTTALILEVSHAHPVVAGMLYCLHRGKDWDADAGERFVAEHMGFWMSSVSLATRSIHVDAAFRPTARERMAFRAFNFIRT
ncbi:hypothetical protein [Ramlibacter sp. AN1133]|uniref:hypothetical protein n=1 Tax=Ramlibacter sp. AN1133 TaxID=3133429 RepID=UPI0030BB683C